MKEIFANYVEETFGSLEQVPSKIKQFEVNYKKYFPVDRQAKILDIGPGRGELLTCLKSWGYKNYLGIDIPPSTIKFCKNLGLPCEQVAETGAWLREHQNEFEVITLFDVLEHIKKDEIINFLKDLNGALVVGGILLIQVPNLQAPDSQLHRYNDFTHEVGFVEHSLKQVLFAAGFKQIKFFGFEQFVYHNLQTYIAKFLRQIFWLIVRFTRLVAGNLRPKILNPVFYVVVKK